LERTSRTAFLWVCNWLTSLYHLRPRPPLLVVLTTTPDSTLCPEAALLMKTALNAKVLTRYALPNLQEAHLAEHVGKMTAELSKEIWDLSAGSAQAFLDIWRELPDSGLIERQEGVWQLATVTTEEGTTTGIGRQIGMAVAVIIG